MTIFTARKRSRQRLCFHRCLSVHRGRTWEVLWWGVCMVVGHAWQRMCKGGVVGDMCGRGHSLGRGAFVARGLAWQERRPLQRAAYPTGMHSCYYLRQKRSSVVSCWDKPVVDPGFSQRSGQKPTSCSGRSAAGSFLTFINCFENFGKNHMFTPPGHPPPTCMELLPDFLIETVYEPFMMF